MLCSLGGTNDSPEGPVSLLQLQQVGTAPFVSLLMAVVPFWVTLPLAAGGSARRWGVCHRISFLGVPEGKVQRSDLAADVLSHRAGEKKQSQALSSGLFPEQSPREEDGFF